MTHLTCLQHWSTDLYMYDKHSVRKNECIAYGLLPYLVYYKDTGYYSPETGILNAYTDRLQETILWSTLHMPVSKL